MMDKIKNILEFLAKVGLPIGAATIWLYTMKINYFPKGVTIGDSFSLLMFALFTSILILLFSLILLTASHNLIEVFSSTQSSLKGEQSLKKWKAYLNNNIDPIITAVLCYAIIYSICEDDSDTFILSTMLGLGITFIIKKSNETPLNQAADLGQIEKLSQPHIKIFLCIFMLLTIALALKSTAFFSLLKFEARKMNIRLEHAIILTKMPHSQIISEYKKSTRSIGEYKEFKDVTVLFNGIGTMTVISLDDKDNGAILEIPKEQVIVRNSPQRSESGKN